jgi:phosphoribosylformylglycinamidine cyclo-ligase
MSVSPDRPLRYADAGVDIEAADATVARYRDIARRASRPEVMGGVGPFAGLFKLGNYREPVIVSSADGVGTKLRIAIAAGRYDTVGQDLVNHCVNDILTTGAEPLFFLDYLATADLAQERRVEVVAGMGRACEENNVALIGGETADMPDMYQPDDFDIAGFIVGVVERDRIIDGSKIRPGDVLIGIPSSGLHTNGFALARRALNVGNGEAADETRTRLAERPPTLGGQSVGDALLATHRPYYQLVAPVLEHVHGIAHITGGGYVENVPRILPRGVTAEFDTAAWPVLPIFRLIQQRGEIAAEEMYEVFNMGIGLVLIVPPDSAAAVRDAIAEAFPIGRIVEDTGRRVELRGL